MKLYISKGRYTREKLFVECSVTPATYIYIDELCYLFDQVYPLKELLQLICSNQTLYAELLLHLKYNSTLEIYGLEYTREDILNSI